MLKNKILLVTGGTGSFGNETVKKFLDTELSEIRIFSRDEKKQDDMRLRFNSDKLKFILGDVRDQKSIDSAMRGVDYVFHSAALKQVPSCEFFPMEAFKTNVLGTQNVIDSAIEHKAKKVICLSTDKAVLPINAMGISKAMMEKIAIARSRESHDTVVSITRYGNVLASRGSVIPLFLNQIMNKKPLTITDPDMTRFIMTLNSAVDLVYFSFLNAVPGDLHVFNAPAASMKNLLQALLNVLNINKYETRVIGTRLGEKKYETLLSKDEVLHAIKSKKYFRIPLKKDNLNYAKFFEEGEEAVSNIKDLNSSNCTQLNIDEIEKILLTLPSIKHFIKNGYFDINLSF